MKSWSEFIEFLSESFFSSFNLSVNFFDGKFIIKPASENWKFEDSEEIMDGDEDYKEFKIKMKKFFEFKQSEDFMFLSNDPTRWVFSKNSKKGKDEGKDFIELMNENNIEEAIPGGKYGCALLLKYYFPNDFQNVSLGKMIALVKKALKDLFIFHYKTLIYLN